MSEPLVQGISDAELAALQRRTLITLVIAQMLGGAGLAAGVTVGALLAEDMLDSTSFSGLPAALFTTGSAAASLLVGRLSQRSGRRVGLAAGYAAGAAGGAGIVVAAVLDSVPLLLLSLLVYGAGTATNLQARYAGADLAGPAHRGRAVSVVLVATTVGAVAGPNLVDATGQLAEQLSIPRLAGPFLLATAAYAVAALVLQLRLRPDPLLTARALGEAPAPTSAPVATTPTGSGGGGIPLAAAAMVLTQIVMVAVMTMTPIHMRDHGHGLGATGLVISIHIACMYLPSPLTGMLADRAGRRPVIAAGGVVLLAAGLLAAVAPADSMVLLTVALALLGLGWNLGLIGGTALLTDSTPLATRARTQGAVDLSVSLAGAAGGLSSGLVVAATSYATLGLAGGAIALLILPILLRSADTLQSR
ncbi:MFS transporter [Conexibacter stalactiti]|uniref:MFS transporter n=1 Tax=Conexibacter stalactiti TaxID=1940611 RepID=A0ABU4HW58_9ACTN|nr:MFS transporter [Conexibacter stalactiti]MDW5597465.1 MFS transporter [Conexibacter stalactiti]MEC5038107.1 MFS transporter [Conexibacter stalactiti]